jgi:hypothetical protein
MRSEEEFKAYWEGALVWSDHELTDEQKTARCRAWFGLEFQCRHAVRDENRQIICSTDGELCVPEILSSKMEYCAYFAQMPCNLLEIIKAQSLQSQATITPEPKESCSKKATVSSEGIGECDHEDG